MLTRRTTRLATVFFLLPFSASADTGSLGGVVAIGLSTMAVTWAALVLLMFLILRRNRSISKPLVCALILLLSPMLLAALVVFKEYALGEYYSEVAELTDQPINLVGVNFPPGSRVNYEQTGGIFGSHARRVLLDIRAPHPVKWAGISIDGFAFERGTEQIRRVDMSGDQVVDGWLCAAAGGIAMDVTPQGPMLRACRLATPREWRGRTIPAGTYVTRYGGDADWEFLDP